MMWGKHYASMYEGSMIGAGAVAFAVMGYVIAKQERDKTVGSQVRLNPVLLGAILGEDAEDVEAAIHKLCSPDPKSTTKTNEGRRLIRIGEFDYQVVNGAKYMAIRDSENRREQNREAQRRFRKKNGKGPSAGAQAYERAIRNGDDSLAQRILDAPPVTELEQAGEVI